MRACMRARERGYIVRICKGKEGEGSKEGIVLATRLATSRSFGLNHYHESKESFNTASKDIKIIILFHK